MMPLSNPRIIRGNQASAYTNWSVSIIGTQYDGPVDKLLTEISREHAHEGRLLPPKELSEEEVRLQNWAMELKEREAQLMSLEEEAVQRGLAHGQQVGYEAGFKEAESERERLTEAAQSIEHEFEQFKHGLSEKLLDLALLVSKKILADTLTLHPENASMILAQLLDSMQLNHEHITLRCNQATRQAITKQLGADGSLANIRFVEDKSQLGNGFILQHPEGEVDASLQTRWLKITEAMGKKTPLSKDDLNDE